LRRGPILDQRHKGVNAAVVLAYALEDMRGQFVRGNDTCADGARGFGSAAKIRAEVRCPAECGSQTVRLP
jgi:hypothetical protein